MKIQLRTALVCSASALALLAGPAAALAEQGDGAITESSATSTMAMTEMPPGMHVMMNSPGHASFMASPGHEHVMTSPGHEHVMTSPGHMAMMD